MDNPIRFNIYHRPVWPVIDTFPIVQGMLDRLILQESKDLIKALDEEIIRLRGLDTDEQLCQKLEAFKEELQKIVSEEDPNPNGETAL